MKRKAELKVERNISEEGLVVKKAAEEKKSMQPLHYLTKKRS